MFQPILDSFKSCPGQCHIWLFGLVCFFIYLFTWLLRGSEVCEDPTAAAGANQESPEYGEHGVWSFQMAFARLWGALEEGRPAFVAACPGFVAARSPAPLFSIFTLSRARLKGEPRLNKTVESIYDPHRPSLHILIICVTISLWPFSLGIHLMYSCKEMFCTEGGKKKSSPVQKAATRTQIQAEILPVIAALFSWTHCNFINFPCLWSWMLDITMSLRWQKREFHGWRFPWKDRESVKSRPNGGAAFVPQRDGVVEKSVLYVLGWSSLTGLEQTRSHTGFFFCFGCLLVCIWGVVC